MTRNAIRLRAKRRGEPNPLPKVEITREQRVAAAQTGWAKRKGMKDYEKHQLRIVCAACRDSTGEYTVIGVRHFDDAMQTQISCIERILKKELDWSQQGFIDQHRIFYTRQEAWRIATLARQIKFPDHIVGELFSEHLY